MIPYFRLDRYVRETLASAAAQTHPATEIVIVNDGSLREEDRIVYELAEEFEARVVTQVNSGLGAARNFGIAQSRGRYVLPLDADDVIAPEFVARCVHALERNEELAYVTSWVEYMDPSGRPASDENGGYYPFGNWSELIERNNVGGTCVALIRRSLFEQGFAYSTDLTSYEDWLLYLELHHAGHHGGVIPERLIRYRVRDESMMRTVGAPRLGPALRRATGPSTGAADQLDRSRRGVGPMRERIVRSVPGEIVGYARPGDRAGRAPLVPHRRCRRVLPGRVDLRSRRRSTCGSTSPGASSTRSRSGTVVLQRLYSTLLAPLWGPLPTSTAYTAAHVLNVSLLVSAIVPTALLARRVIDSPALRVLAVALGTVVPWLMIGSHLLTENLAFPLYMWAVYAIVRCAEEPSLARQAGALGVIAALTLCRLNLGFVIAVLFVAVIVAEAMRRREERDLPLGDWFLRVLKREALIVAACVVVAVMAAVLVVRGGSALSGHYGGLDFDTSFSGSSATPRGTHGARSSPTCEAWWLAGSCSRWRLGLASRLPGLLGRLGRRFVIPSLVALLGLAVVVIVVSTSTVGGALEERYVMYVYHADRRPRGRWAAGDPSDPLLAHPGRRRVALPACRRDPLAIV